MQISPKVKKVWDTAMTVLVVLVVLLAVLLVGVRLCGLQVYSVLSGSMEPDYPVGSLIYVRKVDYKALKPNDVITYRLDEKTLSTHRIVRVQTEGGYRFYMKAMPTTTRMAHRSFRKTFSAKLFLAFRCWVMWPFISSIPRACT